VPCGISDRGVTSLAELCGRKLEPKDEAPAAHRLLGQCLEQAASPYYDLSALDFDSIRGRILG